MTPEIAHARRARGGAVLAARERRRSSPACWSWRRSSRSSSSATRPTTSRQLQARQAPARDARVDPSFDAPRVAGRRVDRRAGEPPLPEPVQRSQDLRLPRADRRRSDPRDPARQRADRDGVRGHRGHPLRRAERLGASRGALGAPGAVGGGLRDHVLSRALGASSRGTRRRRRRRSRRAGGRGDRPRPRAVAAQRVRRRAGVRRRGRGRGPHRLVRPSAARGVFRVLTDIRLLELVQREQPAPVAARRQGAGLVQPFARRRDAGGGRGEGDRRECAVLPGRGLLPRHRQDPEAGVLHREPARREPARPPPAVDVGADHLRAREGRDPDGARGAASRADRGHHPAAPRHAADDLLLREGQEARRQPGAK